MKMNKKIIIGIVCICVAAVVILAALQHFKVGGSPGISSEPYIIDKPEEEQPEEPEEVYVSPEPTQAVEPTSTPKPLPTATITPIPTPVPTEPEIPEGQVVEYPDPSQQTGTVQTSDGTVVQQFPDQQQVNTPSGEQNNGPFVLKNTVFIGDERTKEMINVSTNGNDLWECTNGGGCNWFLNSAISDVESFVNNGTAVVIALGLNDLNNASAYVGAINNQAQIWQAKGAKVFFVSVGPVDTYSNISNRDIMNFNTSLYQFLNIPFIDLYNYLVQTGFATTDGQIYDLSTSSIAYNYISECVRSNVQS